MIHNFGRGFITMKNKPDLGFSFVNSVPLQPKDTSFPFHYIRLHQSNLYLSIGDAYIMYSIKPDSPEHPYWKKILVEETIDLGYNPTSIKNEILYFSIYGVLGKIYFEFKMAMDPYGNAVSV